MVQCVYDIHSWHSMKIKIKTNAQMEVTEHKKRVPFKIDHTFVIVYDKQSCQVAIQLQLINAKESLSMYFTRQVFLISVD